jgi:hypothetical protein
MRRNSQRLRRYGLAVLMAGFCQTAYTPIAYGDPAYIKEVEGLLLSLPRKDATRLPLTMKLADALFDEAVGLANNPMPTEAETKVITRTRRRAISFYEEAMTGLGGMFSPPNGTVKGKIQFQLARLFSDEGQLDRAENLWRSLVNQNELTDLKRESALRLGELLENRNTTEGLKTAENYYSLALKLCSSQDVCSYIHYRLAWVAHRQSQTARAISEVKQALWDSKGQVREEALRDLLAFLAVEGTDGKVALDTVEELDAKLHRPTLKMDLADGFFAAGNKKAGTYVLEHITKRSPSLRNYARLMEEFYGFRDGAKLDTYLDEAFQLANSTRGDTKDQEVEKILRRLTVQLDGERVTKPEYAEKFKKTVLLYLAIFPTGPERTKMIDGWLVAEKNPEAKMNQLRIWIAEEKARGQTKDEIRLREMRASAAQKGNQLATVVEEMAALVPLEPNADKKRALIYQQAHSLYKMNQYDQAMPLFRQLAQVTSTIDKWAVQSQHLTLDILGQRKQYDEVVRQVQTWTKNPNFDNWIQAKRDLADELQDMKRIEQSARFEWAIAQGEKSEALALFKNYCETKQLLPKSCDNARILAVKLKDQPALLAILKLTDKKDELAAEYEASGHFSEAAEMAEEKWKVQKSPSLTETLKLALLYELASRNPDRNRILRQMIARFGSQKAWGPEEDLVYQTLKDAELLDATSLKLPWNKDNRTRLIDALETSGRGTAETKRILIASCEHMGTAWAKTALSEVKALDRDQAKITFTGKRSKQKFMARLDALKKVVKRAECYLQGADARTRVLMATVLERSHLKLAEEIKASAQQTGAGSDLTPEMIAQLQASLAEMASPFEAKAQSYRELALEQLAKVESPAEQVVLKEKIAANDEANLDLPSGPQQTAKAGAIDRGVASSALKALHRNPNEREPLEKLKELYTASGQKRLAAYYQGRLIQLDQGGK